MMLINTKEELMRALKSLIITDIARVGHLHRLGPTKRDATRTTKGTIDHEDTQREEIAVHMIEDQVL